MRNLIAAIGITLLMGCASTSTNEVPATAEVPEISIQAEVIACVNGLMAQQAHVLDATKACSHIYGLDESRGARTAKF